MASNVVFVLVHGAWGSTETWDLLIPLLKECGYESAAVAMPSTSTPTPVQNMDPDTESIRKVVEQQVSKGKDVVVVMHSYGGFPGSEAMKYFVDNNDGANGRGRVIRLAYISAFIPKSENCFIDQTGGKPPPAWAVSGDIFETTLTAERLYPEWSTEASAPYYRQLRPMAYRTMFTKTTIEPYRNIRSAYWHAELDPLPLEVQKAMVAEVMEKAPGMFDLIVQKPYGHMAPITAPGEVADFLVKAATTALS
ncbi:Alpha/beta hydrolase fold-1 [Xylogone sp. PMI_703]|nr:Alpha/beta hydrolase fold-1 [Xylogone sp. PMI_703]